MRADGVMSGSVSGTGFMKLGTNYRLNSILPALVLWIHARVCLTHHDHASRRSLKIGAEARDPLYPCPDVGGLGEAKPFKFGAFIRLDLFFGDVLVVGFGCGFLRRAVARLTTPPMGLIRHARLGHALSVTWCGIVDAGGLNSRRP